MSKYRSENASIPGWIVELGNDRFHHRFGGASWHVCDSNTGSIQPALLLTLDLADPRLTPLSVSGMDELPLCSHINCDAWVSRQVFQIDSKARTVMLEERECQQPEGIPPELAFPIPLPEKPVSLREMNAQEIPIDESTYWHSCDSFLGETAFIRILGAPLWLQDPIHEQCQCGSDLVYAASIGYERFDRPGGFIHNRPFFIGEGSLYFFLCHTCQRIVVRSQST